MATSRSLRGLSGSPRAVGSTRPRRSPSRLASLSVSGLRPAPGRLTRRSFLRFLGRAKRDLLTGLDPDRLPRAWIAAHPRFAPLHLEDSETDDTDLIALHKMRGKHVHRIAEHGDRAIRGQLIGLGDLSGDVLQRHDRPSRRGLS